MQEKNKKTKTLENKILKAIEKILRLVGVDVQTKIERDRDEIIVQIQSNEPGLLIGKHGETLDAIQTVLFQMFYSDLKNSDIKRVVVNVNDWLESRRERLSALANYYSRRAVESGEPQHIFNLSPSDRRYIHLFLQNSKSVYTQSVGEGKDRHLVIYPKN